MIYIIILRESLRINSVKKLAFAVLVYIIILLYAIVFHIQPNPCMYHH